MNEADASADAFASHLADAFARRKLRQARRVGCFGDEEAFDVATSLQSALLHYARTKQKCIHAMLSFKR